MAWSIACSNLDMPPTSSWIPTFQHSMLGTGPHWPTSVNQDQAARGIRGPHMHAPYPPPCMSYAVQLEASGSRSTNKWLHTISAYMHCKTPNDDVLSVSYLFITHLLQHCFMPCYCLYRRRACSVLHPCLHRPHHEGMPQENAKCRRGPHHSAGPPFLGHALPRHTAQSDAC